MNLNDQDKFYKTIGLVSNILFVPLLAIILMASILMYTYKMNNGVPSLFGLSVVTVENKAMEPQFKEGSKVVVTKIDPTKLVEGDIIAFYDYSTGETSDENSEPNTDVDNFLEDHQKVKNYSKVVFHRIKKISTPTNPNDPNAGKLFFYTQGDSEDSKAVWIMQDYVIGRYSSTSFIVTAIFTFATSFRGSVVLIIAPSGVLCFLLILTLLHEWRKYKKANKYVHVRVPKRKRRSTVATVDEINPNFSKRKTERVKKKMREDNLKNIWSDVMGSKKKK